MQIVGTLATVVDHMAELGKSLSVAAQPQVEKKDGRVMVERNETKRTKRLKSGKKNLNVNTT